MTLIAIAHRAGNSLPALRAAAEVGADVVEADVHAHRGHLEVRHSKSLGPLPWLWDRGPWELTPRSIDQLHLPELLDELVPHATLMLDLKGISPVGRRTAELLHERRPEAPVIVCSRWWPSVEPFFALDWALPVLSARNRAELTRLRRRVRRGCPPYAVSLHGSLLSEPVVAELREQVDVVMSWGVNDASSLERVTALGVTGIISDCHDVLRTVVASRHG